MPTKGRGTKLSYSDTSNGTFADIARLVEVTPPKTTVDVIDTTHMESPDDYKEKEPGWKDAEAIEGKVQFEKAQAATLQGLVGVTKFYKITFSDGSSILAKGFISELGDEVEKDGIISTAIKIEVSGKPTFAPAA